MAPMIHCPHCDRPLSEHERPCPPKLTRRVLFGLFAGATAAMAIPDIWGKSEVFPRGFGIPVSDGDLVYREDHLPFIANVGIPPSEMVARHLEIVIRPAWGDTASNTVDAPMLRVRNVNRPFWRRQS